MPVTADVLPLPGEDVLDGEAWGTQGLEDQSACWRQLGEGCAGTRLMPLPLCKQPAGVGLGGL